MKMKIDKNMKYALYFGGALIATYIVVKIIENNKGGDGGSANEDTPTPETPTTSEKVGLNAQQTKQEELQSLLGFQGADIDHIIGKNTIARYNALNLGLGIDLTQKTSVADLQKIIDAIKAKNKKEATSSTSIATRNRARDMVQAWSKNPTSVLVPLRTTKLHIINLDKTTNKYVPSGLAYIYGPSNKFTRKDLGVLSQAVGFNAPHYIIFRNSLGTTLLANPNDWIIK